MGPGWARTRDTHRNDDELSQHPYPVLFLHRPLDAPARERRSRMADPPSLDFAGTSLERGDFAVPQIVPPTGCYCAPLGDTSGSCSKEGIREKYKQ
jgi:hypothetical protein